MRDLGVTSEPVPANLPIMGRSASIGQLVNFESLIGKF